MEEDIKKLKKSIENFIEKYQLKAFKVNTDINFYSKFNTANPKKWITEYYSTVEKIDISLTK